MEEKSLEGDRDIQAGLDELTEVVEDAVSSQAEVEGHIREALDRGEFVEVVDDPTRTPRRKNEDGSYNYEIPHISEVRDRTNKYKERQREIQDTKPDSIEEQIRRAQEKMEEFMAPPIGRPARRAKAKEMKEKGRGFTKPRYNPRGVDMLSKKYGVRV